MVNLQKAKMLENNLYALINNSGLSVDTAFYVLKSVYLDLKNSFESCLLSETDNKDVTTSPIEPIHEEIKTDIPTDTPVIIQ